MTDKTKLHEALGTFIDSVASGDEEGQRDAMKSFIAGKSQGILEFTGDSAIKLDGDDVVVHGKVVGQTKTDAEDMDSGINFVSKDGKFSREFDSAEDLYSFVSDRFNVKEGVLDLTEADLTEGKADVDKAVSKQDAGKASRLARWAKVKKANAGDSKEGDYDKANEKTYVDPEKGGPDAAFDGGEKDLETDGGYESHDPRNQHKDPIKGGSEAAHAGAEKDLETDGHYDSADVRTKHNS